MAFLLWRAQALMLVLYLCCAGSASAVPGGAARAHHRSYSTTSLQCPRPSFVQLAFLLPRDGPHAICTRRERPKVDGENRGPDIELEDLVSMEKWRNKVLQKASSVVGGTSASSHTASTNANTVSTPSTSSGALTTTAAASVSSSGSSSSSADSVSCSSNEASAQPSTESSTEGSRGHNAEVLELAQEEEAESSSARDHALRDIEAPLDILRQTCEAVACVDEPTSTANSCKADTGNYVDQVPCDMPSTSPSRSGEDEDEANGANLSKHRDLREDATHTDAVDEAVEAADASMVASIPPLNKRDPVAKIKQWFNYASRECGAKILGHNSEASEASAVLDKSRDSYMLNLCAATDKWVIIELCEEIAVSSIEMGNYEMFSSNFKEFGIFVSDSYVDHSTAESQLDSWTFVGNFTARNIRELQLFSLRDDHAAEANREPSDFVKIEFYSHYGDEFYCPLSYVQVHGSNMVQELKEQWHRDVEEVLKVDEAAQQTRAAAVAFSDAEFELDDHVLLDEAHHLEDILSDVMEALQERPSSSDLSDTYAVSTDVFSVPVEFNEPDDGNGTTADPATISLDDSDLDENVTTGWKDVLSQTSELVKKLEEPVPPPAASVPTPTDVQLAATQELISKTQVQGKSTQKTQNVFVKLADRVKQLEINQSLAVRYLEDVTSRSLAIFREAKDNLARIKQEHVALSQAVHAAATHGAAMQIKFENDMERLILEGVRSASLNLTAQLMNIQQSHREDMMQFVWEMQIVALGMSAMFVIFGMACSHLWIARSLASRHGDKLKEDMLETLSLRLKFEVAQALEQRSSKKPPRKPTAKLQAQQVSGMSSSAPTRTQARSTKARSVQLSFSGSPPRDKNKGFRPVATAVSGLSRARTLGSISTEDMNWS